jgi:hypothetical protein
MGNEWKTAVGESQRSVHLEGLGVVGRIILKWVSKK